MSSIVLSFSPAIECFNCDEPATHGVYDDQEQSMRPGCPDCGYVWDVDQAAEYASIERFVVSCFSDQGSAKVLSRLPDVEHDPELDDSGCTDYGVYGATEQKSGVRLVVLTKGHAKALKRCTSCTLATKSENEYFFC